MTADVGATPGVHPDAGSFMMLHPLAPATDQNLSVRPAWAAPQVYVRFSEANRGKAVQYASALPGSWLDTINGGNRNYSGAVVRDVFSVLSAAHCGGDASHGYLPTCPLPEA